MMEVKYLDYNNCSVCKKRISFNNDCDKCFNVLMKALDEEAEALKLESIPNYDYKMDANYSDEIYEAYRDNPELLERLNEET